MAKSLSGVELRAGSTKHIGDNRYGLREAYDPKVDAATKKYYRDGAPVVVTEVKNPLTQVITTIKPTGNTV
jgi:hypothetical protein|tara:strand:+ start:4638 stop:4850 length:213 start_codon:yes stop_codon:yes gene_type:complete